MVIKEYSSLGYKWPITVPETLAECVASAGSEEIVVKSFNDHVVFHSTLTGVRADVMELVAQATGISPKTKVTGKDDAGNEKVEIDETEQEYVDRVCALQNTTIESLVALSVTVKIGDNTVSTTIRDEVLRRNPYDAKARERKPRAPRQPTKTDKATAAAVVKAGKADEIAAMLATTLGREVKTDEASLAQAIMEDRLAEEQRLKAAQASKFGVSAS